MNLGQFLSFKCFNKYKGRVIMSEINNDDINFNIKNRQFSIKKSDFKENKKEIFLFDFFTKNSQNKMVKSDNKRVSIQKLDMEAGTEGIITKQDIQIFLLDKNVQKNNITLEDIVKFINKMLKLNPTKEEQEQSTIAEKYKDESGKSVFTPQLKALFGIEYKSVKESDIFDEDKNVKKGMEVFDLNNDGKIDNVEEEFLSKNTGYTTLSQLKETFEELEKADNSDGKITKEDKLAIYNKTLQKRSKIEHEKLNNMEITDDAGNNVITNEIKVLFADGKDSVSFDKIADEFNGGKIKAGMELFDLNGDDKLDNIEKAYFTNNGHFNKNPKEQLELNSFLDAIVNLDNVGYVQGKGKSVTNNMITEMDKRRLYKMLSSGEYMLDNIKTFPKELQDKYVEVLNRKGLYDHKAENSVGISRKDCIEIDSDSLSEPEIASVMVHEFAHSILSDNMPPLLQEVVTFYSEYRLYSEAVKNDSDYKQKIEGHRSGSKTESVDMQYMDFIDNLRKENPNMSEKDLAIEAFLKFEFDSYNGRYQEKVTEDYIRNANYDAAKEFFSFNE